jgi:hypothetical protein
MLCTQVLTPLLPIKTVGTEASMKAFYPIILVQFLILPLALSGCAALNLKSLGFCSDTQDDQDVSEDPVAAAAARFRSPSSSDQIQLREGSQATPHAAPRDHILMGMRMDEVQNVWGQPSSVETAGESREGNQRWTYFSGLSSRWGMGSRRVVYFENGRVAGWKQ